MLSPEPTGKNTTNEQPKAADKIESRLIPTEVIADSEVGTRVYTRTRHGSLPVDLGREEIKVWHPEGVQVYQDPKRVISELYHKPRAPMSFERYFRLGSFSPPRPAVSTLDLFLRGVEAPAVITTQKSLGIDLADWHTDVRKIFGKFFARRCKIKGYDEDDVLQEIYRGILARNNGTCPFDETKSSRGHYIYIVCGCVLANYQRREVRRARKEQVGMKTMQDGEFKDTDAASAAVDEGSNPDADQDNFRYQMAMGSLNDWIQSESELMGDAEQRRARNVMRILPLVSQNHTMREIAQMTGLKSSEVSSAMKMLRNLAKGWATEEGLPLSMLKTA